VPLLDACPHQDCFHETVPEKDFEEIAVLESRVPGFITAVRAGQHVTVSATGMFVDLPLLRRTTAKDRDYFRVAVRNVLLKQVNIDSCDVLLKHFDIGLSDSSDTDLCCWSTGRLQVTVLGRRAPSSCMRQIVFAIA
jgi:hypothetical protein